MFKFILACIIVSVTSAIVCPPNACDGVKKEVLNCKGGVLEKAGFCGCTDVCARVENEPCEKENFFFGMPHTKKCDDGLVCAPFRLEGHVQGHRCITQETHNNMLKSGNTESLAVSRRSGCQTTCQRKSLKCTFSMVIYEGQWFAKCDLQGNFLKQQCDNTKHCFCVHPLTGAIQEGTKAFGAVQC